MLSRAAIKVEKVAEKILPAIQQQNYSAFHVVDQNSSQDDSKCGHPAVVKQSCESKDCNSKNCVNDISICDSTTIKVEIVGHKTNSPEGALTNEAVKLVVNPTNVDGVVAIYNRSEPIKDLVEGYRYHESKELQTDENTNLLNELIRNQEIHED
jgi:hypothetical protein